MQNDTAAVAGLAIVGLIFMVIYLAIIVVCIAGVWKTFSKAGQPGWAAIIPFYGAYIYMKVIGRPGWWWLLFLIPVAGFVFAIIAAIDLAKSFGRSTGFAIGLIFLGPIFYCILGFGSAKYLGPAAAQPPVAA